MTKPVRIPEYLYDAVRIRAESESRSVANMTKVLLETALATDVMIVPANTSVVWPEPVPEVPVKPSSAEREWATGDPVDESEAETVFVPIQRVEHATAKPDFKPERRKR